MSLTEEKMGDAGEGTSGTQSHSTAEESAASSSPLQTRRGKYKRPSVSALRSKKEPASQARRIRTEAQEEALSTVLAAADALIQEVTGVASAAEVTTDDLDRYMAEIDHLMEALAVLPKSALNPKRRAAAEKATTLKHAELGIMSKLLQQRKQAGGDAGEAQSHPVQKSARATTKGRARATSFSSWQGLEDNPYLPSGGKKPEWWDDFPFPWNVRPRTAGGLQAGELVRFSPNSIPKFTGYTEEYSTWRQAFIPCVHTSSVDISLKMLALLSSLDPKTSQMREIKKSIVGTPDGYKAAIFQLERTFGGEDALLITRQQALLSLPPIREGDYSALELLHIRLGTFITEWGGMSSRGAEVDSLAFFHVVMGKVEPSFGRKYMDWIRTTGNTKNLSSLHEWTGEQLEDHRYVDTLNPGGWQNRPRANSLGNPGAADRGTPWRQQRQTQRIFKHQEGISERGKTMGAAESYARQCPLCEHPHPLAKCYKFKDMQPHQRKEFLTQKRRCYLCFQERHNANNCRMGYKCAACGGGHHTMLHERKGGGEGRNRVLFAQQGETPFPEDTEGAGDTLDFHYKCTDKSSKVSLRTIGVFVGRVGSPAEEYVTALLDDGSTSSALVSEELAEELELKGHLVRTITEGVGGKTTEADTLMTNIRLRSASGALARIIPAQVFAQPAGTYQPVDWNEQKHQFKHLRNIKFPPRPKKWSGIHILLGNKNPHFHTALEEKTVGENTPAARKTPLGWTAVGPVEATEEVERRPLDQARIREARSEGYLQWSCRREFVSLERTNPTDKQLVRLLSRMMEVEDDGDRQEMSPDETYLFDMMKEKGKVQEGQWELPCTWRPGGGRPKENYKQALGRLESLEKSKYFKDIEVKKQYGEAVEEWHGEKFVKELEDRSVAKHFLPHFPVIKQESLTTSLRVVMDCSVALNAFLLSGPKLMNDVAGVLLRFRSRPVAFTGDVSKMFLRIKMLPEDQPYHCFLWRTEATQEPKIFMFQVHVFGNAGSPFVAIYAVREQARKFANRYPAAADTISQSSLVDDILDSADTVEEAAATLQQVREILADVGMEVRKCMSNEPAVLAGLPKGARAEELLDLTVVCTKDPQLKTLKTLGIRYDHKQDEFFFEMHKPEENTWTKRKILRLFPRLYDPLGMLLPYTMTARCIFSAINKDSVGWDEELESRKLKRWWKWLGELQHLGQIRIPRCVKLAPKERKVELHVFADASSTAYAAVCYVLVKYDSTTSTRMVMARAKVSPPKQSSIPRLELLGAELATQLGTTVQQNVKLNVSKVVYWSDSLNVLFWLKNHSQRLQSFVENRVRRIKTRTESADWRWVPTAENPADLPTRGRSPQELAREDLWWEGPKFLLLTEEEWPQSPRLLLNEEGRKELRKIEQVFVATGGGNKGEEVLHFQRASSWKKLLQVASLCLRWKYDKVEAARRAEKAIIRQIQVGVVREMTKETWKAGRQKLGLHKLEPVLDADGLLRGRGRLSHIRELGRDVREPLYLPRDHKGTQLLIRHVHEQVCHHVGGVSHTLARLHEKYWIHRARRTAYSIVTACIACKRRLARPTKTPQGQLPVFRIPLPGDKPLAFEEVGMDCAGPFKVKRGRATELHYLLLLTCCKTRAVKLEWLSSLSVDSLLLALSRVSEKGVKPRTILSDNGSNFEAANNMRGLVWQALEQERGELERRNPTITWKFNPPYASHYGGVFERLIGAAKQALYHAVPISRTLTLEQLVTAFAIVEGTLNSRPLAYVAGEAAEAAPLTPNHFLYGSASMPIYEIPDCPTTNLAKKWLEVQELGDAYWKRLQREILPLMQHRTKLARQDHRNIQIGDVVVFLNEKERGSWPLARVAAVHPGPDGVVRTIELVIPQLAPGDSYKKMGEKRFKRDVSSVSLLLEAAAVSQ